jgi:hypothetical protein
VISRKSLKERSRLGELGIEDRIKLKCILNKQGVRVGNGILKVREGYVPAPNIIETSGSTGTGIAQSVQQLATGWTGRGSNLREGEIFCTRLDRPWGPPRLLYDVYQVSPGGKAAVAWR